MRSRVTVTVLAAAFLIVLPSSVNVGAEDTGLPTVEVVANADAETLTYEIAGAGWAAGSLVQLELCGNNAEDGSVDCAVGAAQIVAADAGGVIRGRLSTSPPPTPCPCVVRAVSLDSDDTATTPIRVPGVPELPTDPEDATETPAIAELTVNSSLIQDGSPWGPWLGTPPERLLVLVVTNSGNVPVDDVILSMTLGRSESSNGFIEPVALGDLAVGEVRELSVPVELPAFAWGDYVVHGELSGTTEPTEFTETTSAYPWLLVFAAVFAVLHLALVLTRRAIRRRLSDDDPPEDGPTTPQPPGLPPPMLAIGAGDRALGPGDPPTSNTREVGADLVYVIEVAERHGAGTLVLDRGVEDRLVYVDHDEYRHRAVYAVVGLRATKALISSALRTRGDDVSTQSNRRRSVETISIPPIVTASEGEIENASTELGHWLGSELGVPVYLSSRRNGAGPRTFVRVGDGPDFETPRARPTSSWLRLESGIPTVTYRIAFASGRTGKLDALVAALQADGIRASLDHHGWETEMTIRTHDTGALADARDRVADQAEIQHEQLVGLLPLCMLDGVDVPTLQRLGIAAADTFEYQLIALGNTRSLEAARRQLSAADIASLSEVEIDWTVAPSTAPDLTLAPPRGDLATASVRR